MYYRNKTLRIVGLLNFLKASIFANKMRITKILCFILSLKQFLSCVICYVVKFGSEHQLLLSYTDDPHL